MRAYLALAVLGGAVVAGGSASAQEVVDGDTLRIGGDIYRLYGIDAPEASQTCRDAWPAGRIAADHLKAMVAERVVHCERRGRDRYGRTLAVCWADDEDIGARLVSEGWAWAFSRYSNRYVEQQEAAVRARVGLHGHGCLEAWEWRSMHRRGR